MVAPARSNSSRRAGCWAAVVPWPGSARPIASVRQFIELAVNMPEQEPQVGQADSSMSSSSASDTDGSAEAIMGSMRSSLWPPALVTAAPSGLPASIAPPDTNTVGMFSRMAAMNMPGVILSQLEMQISASAQCALTMYSTESAMSSRLGREYSMPPCPMAMPSSTAIVLNSRGIAPADRTASATTRPTSCRWTWPGTNSVKLLATATMGRPMSSRATPVARSRARAPAMFLPCVTVRDRSGGMTGHLRNSAEGHREIPAREFPSDYRSALIGIVERELPGRGRVDLLDLVLAQLGPVLEQGVAAQVFLQPVAVEHVHLADGGPVPGPLAHVDAVPRVASEPLAGLPGLPPGVLQAVLLAERPVPELAGVARPDREFLLPGLGVDGVGPGRPDHEVVDLLLAARDGARGQDPVAGPLHPAQLPLGAPLSSGQPDTGGRHRGGGPRPVDHVGDGGQHRGRQARPPGEDERGHHLGH